MHICASYCCGNIYKEPHSQQGGSETHEVIYLMRYDVSEEPKTCVCALMLMHACVCARRYFDEDFEAAAMRCFKCGGQGHRARECPNEERQRPCFLCGQFGHTRAQCSNSAFSRPRPHESASNECGAPTVRPSCRSLKVQCIWSSTLKHWGSGP